jgi:hypothetical protein
MINTTHTKIELRRLSHFQCKQEEKMRKLKFEYSDLAKLSHFAELPVPQNLKADCVEFKESLNMV